MFCATLFASVVIAQPTTARLMIGGDVGLNFNFMSTNYSMEGKQALPSFLQDFMGRATGISVAGSLLCSIPIGGPHAVVLSANLEELQIGKRATVIIPCQYMDKSGRAVTTSPATTDQEYHLSLTDFTLNAEYQFQSGHVFADGGTGGGAFLANAYKFRSTVVDPDTCYYDYATKSRSRTHDNPLPEMHPRLPFLIRIGLLIPFTQRMYIAPSIGVNLDFLGINESGATITSVQPAMGVRYEP